MPNDILLLAHMSDVHLAPMPRIPVSELTIKRALGGANWLRNRRHVHVRGVLDALVADLKARKPGHIVVTGDLVNLGLPAEHEAALAWLEGLGSTDGVTAIPGNHDAYSRSGRDPSYLRWQAFMRGEDSLGPGPKSGGASGFPFLRRIGPVALIGLVSGVPTRPFVSSGYLGWDQLARLARLLDDTRREGLLRVVAIHHPPHRYRKEARSGLRDAGPFGEVLREAGAELVLHGHFHRPELRWLEGPNGHVPVVGVPSASAAVGFKHGCLAGYNLYAITREREGMGLGAFRIEMIRRGLAEPGGPFIELERKILQ
jgi:3',5'-cyclic AMP phosphodiesterase CpdA